jgi:Tol biopolymer transport system component
MKKRIVLAALAILLLALAGGLYTLRRHGAGEEGGASLVTLPQGLAGAAVYECGDGICKVTLETGEEALLTARGRYPRWSPDGEHVAFLRDNGVMRMRADGSGVELLARAESPGALNYHPGGRQILFTDGREVKSFSLDGGEVKSLLRGRRFMEIDISPSGDRLIATVKEAGFRIFAFDLSEGTERSLATGCSASLSPDGNLFTRLDRSHTRLDLRTWSAGTVRGVIESPRGLKFDNQFWSNHPDWVVSRSEGDEEDIYAHQVSTGRAVRITTSGDADRPDLYLYGVP